MQTIPKITASINEYLKKQLMSKKLPLLMDTATEFKKIEVIEFNFKRFSGEEGYDGFKLITQTFQIETDAEKFTIELCHASSYSYSLYHSDTFSYFFDEYGLSISDNLFNKDDAELAKDIPNTVFKLIKFLNDIQYVSFLCGNGYDREICSHFMKQIQDETITKLLYWFPLFTSITCYGDEDYYAKIKNRTGDEVTIRIDAKQLTRKITEFEKIKQ